MCVLFLLRVLHVTLLLLYGHNKYVTFLQLSFCLFSSPLFPPYSPLTPHPTHYPPHYPSTQVCFIIFYKSSAIESKIKRICDAFSANRYDLSNLSNTHELDKQTSDNFKDMNDVRKTHTHEIKHLLNTIVINLLLQLIGNLQRKDVIFDLSIFLLHLFLSIECSLVYSHPLFDLRRMRADSS